MTENLRVVIVDDESLAREGIRLRLQHEPATTVVGEFRDAERALAAIRIDPPDVVFLDIEMPGLDGFSLVERLGDAQPILIFVTAHERYAVRAFGARALDYLLKPVEQDRLREALAHAREQLAMRRKSEFADRVRDLIDQTEVPAIVSGRDSSTADERLAVRDEGVVRFVEISDIDWIEAAGDAAHLHVGTSIRVIRRSLGELRGLLPRGRFVRIHRSTIVNVARVRELQPWFHGEYIVILQDGTKLKLSRGHRDALGLLGR